MKYIDYPFLVGVNAGLCKCSGDTFGILNEDMIHLAVSCQHSYYDSDENVATAVFRAICHNHGFVNANKRTAVVSLYYMLPPKASSKIVEDVAVKCATGELKDVLEISKLLYN